VKLGILDIGTNSIHMILVNIKQDLNIEVLDRAKEFVRLGEQTFLEGKLSDSAMERGVAALNRFKKLAELRGIQKIKAVATSAVREAVNGGDFVDLIAQKTGIKVKVITGQEEARLIYLAVKNSIPLAETPSVIVDIGGGSVEIVVASAKGVHLAWSVKLGTLRLKGQFIRGDPPSKKELHRLQTHLENVLEPILEKIRSYSVKTLVGTSGTILNLGAMAYLQENSASLDRLHNCRLKAKNFTELHERLVKSDSKARIKIRGLDPQRNDLIIPGSLVLTYIMNKIGVDEVILCEEAIREGMVYDYAPKHRHKIELESEVPDLRMRSVLQLAKKCDYRVEHAQHVTGIALSMFDQTRRLHRMGPAERELLHYAGLLHDIGYHISYKKHHRHTYYLIKNGDLNGFEEREVEILANVGRYHCRSFPKKSHENWSRLSPHDRKTVRVLSALLRVADGLDRSHFSVVKEVRCRLNGKTAKFQIRAKGDPELEVWAAEKKKDLFEKVFDKQVIFMFSPRPSGRKKQYA